MPKFAAESLKQSIVLEGYNGEVDIVDCLHEQKHNEDKILTKRFLKCLRACLSVL